jgi:hypothetical protein
MTIRVLNFPDGFISPTRPADLFGAYSVYPTQEVEDMDELLVDPVVGLQLRPLVGSPGAVIVGGDIFGQGPFVPGCVVTLAGTDETATVTIESSDSDYGALINGNITLGKDHTITLQWHPDRMRWIENGRNI